MVANPGTFKNSRLKTMVIPREHGAWGILLVPLMTGAIVAVGAAINYRALALFLVGALALFWLRTPVEAWLGTMPIRARSPRERSLIFNVSLAIGTTAALAIAALSFIGFSRGLLIIGAAAALAFSIQAVVKKLGRRGRMPAQVIGAIGLTSTAAGASYVASGKLGHVAFALWAANWLFAADQIHFVQVRIHASRAATVREKLRQGYGFLAGQVILFVAVIVLCRLKLFPDLVWLAFVPVMLRGTFWFVRGRESLDVHRLGFSELVQSLIFGLLLCATFPL
jgi:YwiC-like protein